MRRVEEKAVRLTNYLIGLPSLEYLLLAMVLLGALAGFAADQSIDGMLNGFAMLSLPALLIAVMAKIVIRRIPFKQIVATSLFGEIVYAFFFVLSFYLKHINFPYSVELMFVAGAIVFIVWFVIGRVVFLAKWRGLLFATLQLIVYAFALTAMGFSVENAVLKFLISSGVFLVALYFLFLVINAPMKRNLGVSSVDAISMFLAQWFYESKELEEAFEKVGEKVKTIVGGVSFSIGKERRDIIVPYVHFGPFGNLGGSAFPSLLSKKVGESIVLHGTATHDFNPISEDEIENILPVIRKPKKWNSETVELRIGEYGKAKAYALLFGDSGIISITRAPYTTEDISFGLGLSIMEMAEKYLKNAIVADMHNSDVEEITSFDAGSAEGFEYMKAVENALRSKGKKNRLRAGFFSFYPSSPTVGGNGVQVFAISSSPTFVGIVFDGNGISKRMKEALEKKVMEKYPNVVVCVYSTDSHEKNNVRGVLNPVLCDENILENVVFAVGKAIENMKDAKVCVYKEWIDIRVLGHNQAIEIVSTVNSIFAVARIIVPIIFIFAVAAVLYIVSTL
jgi:putative membrane protein